MSNEEMKRFVEAYKIATVRVFDKLLENNPFLKGFIDVEKAVAYIKSNNDS